MKKIGILSMQRIINFGSFLQAYALSDIVRSLGNEVEFVDFKVEPCAVEPEIPLSVDSVPESRKKAVKYILKAHENFNKNILPDINVTTRNENAKVDTLLIGSDEIFNCLQKNPVVGYSLEMFGKNANVDKIISYAASCGDTTYERICKHNKQKEISELLNKFSAISVRDENSREFVEKSSDIKPINHLDPVLIYDFKDVEIDTANLENYIIAYAYDFNFSEEEANYIKEFAKKHNKKILSFSICYQDFADIVVDIHPFEIFSYFRKADFVITNTFHGTIFSIKTHTPFVSFTRNYNTQKLGDLIERLEFQDRRIYSLKELEDKYNKPINFSKCDERLKNERIRSIEYLKENL